MHYLEFHARGGVSVLVQQCKSEGGHILRALAPGGGEPGDVTYCLSEKQESRRLVHKELSGIYLAGTVALATSQTGR